MTLLEIFFFFPKKLNLITEQKVRFYFFSRTVFPEMRKYIVGAKVHEKNKKPATGTAIVDN